jgi:hypothetical protein
VVYHTAIFSFSETESFLTLRTSHPGIGFNKQFTPLLSLSVCQSVPHIIHYFCCISYLLLIHKIRCRAIVCQPAPFPCSWFPRHVLVFPLHVWLFRRKLDTHACCHTILGPLLLFSLQAYSRPLLAPNSSIFHLFSGYNQEVLEFLVPNTKIQNSLRAPTRLKDVNQLSMNT